MSRRGRAVTWVRRVAVLAVLAALLLGLGDRDAPRPTRLPELDVLVVVDRTTSMSALDDPTGSRITAARRDLVRIADNLDPARFTVIGLGGDARSELPVTSDRVAFAEVVHRLQVEAPSAGSGSSVDRVLPVLEEWLTLREGPERPPVLIYAGDGEDTGTGPEADLEPLRIRPAAALVLGYGTETGGVMPLRLVEPGRPVPAVAEAGPLVPDVRTGRPAVSHADPGRLGTLAAVVGGRYVPADGTQDPAALAAALQDVAYADLDPGRPARQVSWLWGLALLLLTLPELRQGWRQWLSARREAIR